jgi:hypothetical protein
MDILPTSRLEGNVEHDIVLGSVERMHHISTSTSHAKDDNVTGQGGHKNRETENRTEAETELTEISVFSINRYFFGFHLY